MRQTKANLYLEVILLEDELKALSKSMADAYQKRLQAEDRLDSFKKQVQSEIASFEATESRSASLISSGKEYRQVECKIEYDFKAKTKKWIRNDTNETAKEDIITEEELQEEADLKDKK